MNPLSNYLKKHKITQMKFAELAGVSQTTISMYCAGKVSPNLNSALKIIKASNNELSITDLKVNAEAE